MFVFIFQMVDDAEMLAVVIGLDLILHNIWDVPVYL